MNKTSFETKSFFDQFNRIYNNARNQIASTIQFGFAVPATSLEVAQREKTSDNMIIAAQNVYFERAGAFTGELSLAMVKDAGANAVIIGHSERRQHFGETNELVNKKVVAVLKSGLTPIVCVGETWAQRQNKQWQQILEEQLKSLYDGIDGALFPKIVIAYEPIWAIGTGVTASTNEAQEACHFVRSVIANLTSYSIAERVLIQYGGSVKPHNIATLVTQKDIDGVLVGGASLQPDMFLKLLTMNK